MPVRPNILLITTDQQRFDTIHAAGNPAIFTPHLNWLCDTGIRFSRMYSDTPVCGPARATIMTGLHGFTHGHTVNNNLISPMASVSTLPGLMTRAGYQTRVVGKMHFNPYRAHYGFEHMEILPDYYRWVAQQPGASMPKDHGVAENEMEPVFSTCEERHSLTHWTVRRSVDFLETRDDTRPFFLWTSFAKPHPPLDPIKNYWDLYDGIDMPDPVVGDWSADIEKIPQSFMAPTYFLNNIHRFSAQKIRSVIRAYYACITQIDYNLGLLFAHMREMGLLDRTWIFFTSDHGEMLGDHHMGAKSVYFEGAAHIPMLIRPPANMGDGRDQRGGSVEDRLACLADLMPTILGLAGVTPPPPLELKIDGLDMFGSRTRDALLGESGPYHVVISGDWKYTFTVEEAAELLFNLAADPRETRNRLNDPAAAPILSQMRGRLIAALSARRHPAVADGRLVSTGPAKSASVLRRNSWPGFHTRSDTRNDLLH